MMETQSGTGPISFERAVCDPAAVFASPQEVLDDPTLTKAEKAEVLKRWAYDADLLAVAESEGMGGGEPSLQGRVLAALNELEAGMASDPRPADGQARPKLPKCD